MEYQSLFFSFFKKMSLLYHYFSFLWKKFNGKPKSVPIPLKTKVPSQNINDTNSLVFNGDLDLMENIKSGPTPLKTKYYFHQINFDLDALVLHFIKLI